MPIPIFRFLHFPEALPQHYLYYGKSFFRPPRYPFYAGECAKQSHIIPTCRTIQILPLPFLGHVPAGNRWVAHSLFHPTKDTGSLPSVRIQRTKNQWNITILRFWRPGLFLTDFLQNHRYPALTLPNAGKPTSAVAHHTVRKYKQIGTKSKPQNPQNAFLCISFYSIFSQSWKEKALELFF